MLNFIQESDLIVPIHPTGGKDAYTPIERRCGVCASYQMSELFWTTDRNLHTTEKRFLICSCLECGVAQTYPQPTRDQLNEFYPDEYYPTRVPSKAYYEKYVRRFQNDKITKLKTLADGGKILDVGCGVGFFVKEANVAGYEAQGIEFSDAAVVVGRERLGLNIHLADFLTHPFDKNSFDVVTFWHTFEHLYNPKHILEKTHSILRPGGLLVIAVPNFSSLQAMLFRGRWFHLDAPRHFFHYSLENLGRLVEHHRFVVRKIDHYSREHNGSGILGSLLHLWSPDEGFVHRLFRKTIGITLANVLALIESTVYQGGTFTLFAIKD